MIKRFFYLLIFVLACFKATHCSIQDKAKEFFEKVMDACEVLAEIALDDFEETSQKEEQQKHGQAMKALKKLNRKYSDDFECLGYGFDGFAKKCLISTTKSKNKHKHLSQAEYFEKIKRHQEASENALINIQKDNEDDYQQAEKISKRMSELRSKYWRLLKEEIQRDRSNR
jgi:hypothetical protein